MDGARELDLHSELNDARFEEGLRAIGERGEWSGEFRQRNKSGAEVHVELILVVDDEDSIRQITKATLETFGYRVLTAADGTEAVGLYAQHRDEVAGVITDMMMPFMDGPATIRALQKMNPQVRIIAASGLGSQDKAAEATAADVQQFLPKPYTAEKLLKALAQLLRGAKE